MPPQTRARFAQSTQEEVLRLPASECEPIRGCAKLHLRDFPVSTFKSGTTVVLLSGTWLGLLDVAGVGNSAVLKTESVNLRGGSVTFVLNW